MTPNHFAVVSIQGWFQEMCSSGLRGNAPQTRVNLAYKVYLTLSLVGMCLWPAFNMPYDSSSTGSIFKTAFVPIEPCVNEKHVAEKVRNPQKQILVGDKDTVQQYVDRVRQGHK